MEPLRDVALVAARFAVREIPRVSRANRSFERPQQALRAEAGFVGRWEGELKGETRVFPYAFEFALNGRTLAGTLEVPSLDKKVALARITVDGRSVRFEGFGRWTGTLSGDELTLTRALDLGRKQQMTAHRVARAADLPVAY